MAASFSKQTWHTRTDKKYPLMQIYNMPRI